MDTSEKFNNSQFSKKPTSQFMPNFGSKSSMAEKARQRNGQMVNGKDELDKKRAAQTIAGDAVSYEKQHLSHGDATQNISQAANDVDQMVQQQNMNH